MSRRAPSTTKNSGMKKPPAIPNTSLERRFGPADRRHHQPGSEAGDQQARAAALGRATPTRTARSEPGAGQRPSRVACPICLSSCTSARSRRRSGERRASRARIPPRSRCRRRLGRCARREHERYRHHRADVGHRHLRHHRRARRARSAYVPAGSAAPRRPTPRRSAPRTRPDAPRLRSATPAIRRRRRSRPRSRGRGALSAAIPQPVVAQWDAHPDREHQHREADSERKESVASPGSIASQAGAAEQDARQQLAHHDRHGAATAGREQRAGETAEARSGRACRSSLAPFSPRGGWSARAWRLAGVLTETETASNRVDEGCLHRHYSLHRRLTG